MSKKIPCPSILLDVSDDILCDIFNRLHAPCSFIGPRALRELSDVFSFGLTCTRLHALAKEAFRSEFRILDICYQSRRGSFEMYFPQYRSYPSLEFLPLFCSNALRVVRVNSSIRPVVFYQLLCNIATHCDNLTELSFSDGMLINNNHKIVTSKLESLKRLEVSAPSNILLQMLGPILPKLEHLRLRNVSYRSLSVLQQCMAWRARSRHYIKGFLPLRTICLKMRTSTWPVLISNLHKFAFYLRQNGGHDLTSLRNFALWVEKLSPEHTRSLFELLKSTFETFPFGRSANFDLHIGHYRPSRFSTCETAVPLLVDTFMRANAWKIRGGALHQAVMPALMASNIVVANGLAAHYYMQRVTSRKWERLTAAMQNACRASKMIVFPNHDRDNGRLDLVLWFCVDLLMHVKSFENVIVSIEYLRFLVTGNDNRGLPIFFKACSRVRSIRIREKEKSVDTEDMSDIVQETITLLADVVRLVGMYCPNLECLNVRLPIVANNRELTTNFSRLKLYWELENVESKCRRLELESLGELANISVHRTLSQELKEDVFHGYSCSCCRIGIDY